ncbi:MAG: hypothetical protein M3264_04695, partial [Thermoproteota archaeon]|nr:hypothetical protein [Thermoproteota archaeon]
PRTTYNSCCKIMLNPTKFQGCNYVSITCPLKLKIRRSSLGREKFIDREDTPSAVNINSKCPCELTDENSF